MSSIRTSNWRTTSFLILKTKGKNSIHIPPGSYVSPISLAYVPEHIKERYPFFTPATETFVYTKYGVFVVPTNCLEEA